MNIFSGQSPKATEIKAKTNQWDLIKLTSFAQQRKPKRKQKDNLQNGRKLFQMTHVSFLRKALSRYMPKSRIAGSCGIMPLLQDLLFNGYRVTQSISYAR